MMMKNKIFFVFFFAVMAFASCKKEEDISNTPEIEFVSVSSSNIAEGTTLTFTISYKDGDGDLGENTEGVKNLFVTDNRVGVTYEYRIQQLSPSGSTVAITGNLNVDVTGTSITDGSTQQQVTYSFMMKDRAGNSSNSVSSPAITIHQ